LLSLTDRPALTVDGSHSLTGHGLHRSLASKKAAIGFSYEGSSSAGKSKQSDDKENSEESAEEEDYADVDLGTSALADSGGGLWIWVRQHPLIQRGGCLCYWGYATLFSFFHGLKTQLTLMQPH